MTAPRTHLPASACRALLCLALAAGCATVAQASTELPAPVQQGLERQVMAAYLLKFAAFVEWPEGSFARPDAPLLIGVAGNDTLAEQAGQMVAGRSVNGHPLTVRRVHRGDSLAGLHILFAGGADKAALAELLAAARNQALLSVSDAHGAAALGCMITFVLAEERLRFEVAMANVAAAGLRISARMLAAAYKVRGST